MKTLFASKKQKEKINISKNHFWMIMGVLLLAVVINTIFLGLSVTPESLLRAYGEANGKLGIDKIKWNTIINFVAMSVGLVAMAVHTGLAYGRIRIGYVYTNIWSIVFMAIVFIPIVMNFSNGSGNFADYRMWVNIGLFIGFQTTMFFVYKEVYIARKYSDYENYGSGGMSW